MSTPALRARRVCAWAETALTALQMRLTRENVEWLFDLVGNDHLIAVMTDERGSLAVDNLPRPSQEAARLN